jgi:hypothetical protein
MTCIGGFSVSGRPWVDPLVKVLIVCVFVLEVTTEVSA